MHKPLSELSKRIIGGGLFAAIAGVDIWLGGVAFSIMLAIAAILLLREFLRLTVVDAGLGSLAAVSLWPVLAIIVFQTMAHSAGPDDQLTPVLSLTVLLTGGLLLTVWRSLGRSSTWLAIGIGYVGVPIVALQWLREAGAGHGLAHVGWLVAVVVATDIFAYIVGRSIGGAKLAPRLSPGKTWSGLLGGVSGAMAVGAICGYYWMPGWSLWALLPLAGLLAVLAQMGDLFESWLKRRAGRKDSGSLIPGHGGLMDRLDGYLTATPAFALILLLAEPGL